MTTIETTNSQVLTDQVLTRLCGCPRGQGAVMGTAMQRLREVAELLPEGASVLLSKEALLGALEAVPGPTDDSPEAGADLTIEQVARRFGRSASTVRSWISAGRLVGAYKFRNKEWRLPEGTLTAFESAERSGGRGASTANPKSGALAHPRSGP